MAGRHRRATVRKLSNLSIDEVSLVDRGANQHASVEIAKRAPQADDYFEDVEKFGSHDSPGKTAALSTIPVAGPYIAAARQRQSKTGWHHGGLKTFGGEAAGAYVGSHTGAHIGRAIAGAAKTEGEARELAGVAGHLGGTAVGSIAGTALGGAMVVHHHYANSHFNKSAEGDVTAPQADDYFSKGDQTETTVTHHSRGKERTNGSSFGEGGNSAGVDEINEDSDPSGIRDDVEATGSDHAGGSAPKSKGETVPAGNGKKSKVGKSMDFWSNFVSKVLGEEEFTTEDDTDDTLIGKHFPGAPNQPFGGGQPGPSMGQPPVMQSVGAQPYGMGQPQPPMGAAPQMGGQAQSGLGALPPEAVQYIQQLEQRISELEGEGDDSGDQSSSGASQDSSTGRNGDKSNPFGKRADEMDTSLFLSELAKSLDDEDQRVAVEKALYEVNIAKSRAEEAEKVAKAERDLRLEREFVAKAAEFGGLPVSPQILGPVLKRAAEGLDREDFDTIVKCLRVAGENQEPWFAEVGKRGGGSNGSILDEVEAAAAEIEKSAGGLSREQAAAQVLEMNPRMYDQYLAERSGR